MAARAETGFELEFPSCGRNPADGFAAPRELYVLLIPALLAATGLLSWAMGDQPGMVVASFVGSGVAFFTLWDWIYREGPTRFSTLLAMALLLGYAFGALNTWATLPLGSITLADVYGFEPGVLSRGLGAVLLAASALYSMGEMFERPLFARGFRFQFSPRMRVMVYLGALAMLAGYVTHSLGFEGAKSGGGRVSVFGEALMWAYPEFVALSVAMLITSRRRVERILAAISTLIYLLMLSVLGRRAAIYAAVMILLVLPFAGFRLRGLSAKKILLLSALGAVVVVSALTFELLRIAGYSIGSREPSQLTVARRIEVARQMALKGGAYALAARTSQKNIQTRTFMLAFFSNILDASSRMAPAMGKDAEGMFQLVIPHVIDPGKNAFFAEENLDDAQFGFSYGDQANSIVTAGATDFGLVGVLLYPLLLALLFRLFYEFFAPYVERPVRLIAALALVNVLLATEDTLSGYFVSLRDTLLFCALIAVFLKLPSLRFRSPERMLP